MESRDWRGRSKTDLYGRRGRGGHPVKNSYAASDGGQLTVDSEVISLLGQFSHISCREESLTRKLKTAMPHRKVTTVCDPVFLLSRDEWLSLTPAPPDRGYILTYYADGELTKKAQELALHTGKQIFEIGFGEGRCVREILGLQKPPIIRKNASPLEFVSYIAHADIVLTRSFHAVAFSIILERPFYALKFETRSERITDLLKEVGLTSRWVDSVPDGNHSIEYTDEVRSRLAALNQRSVEFLLSCKQG